MKKIILSAVIGVLLGSIGFLIWRFAALPKSEVENGEVEAKYNFANPKKSAHYESNTPEHGSVIPAVPINVVIDFNFDLTDPSEIKILNNGKDYGVGATVIDPNKLALRRAMDPAAPDGIYKVEYKACWPDGSCHTGHFQFAVDVAALRVGEYFDLSSRKEVLITMKDITLNPRVIVVDKGTKIFWKNEDEDIHYVNTDSHPAHTYYPAQNSQALEKGDSFSLVFDKPGFYPYHCSAHPEMMRGWIIVK